MRRGEREQKRRENLESHCFVPFETLCISFSERQRLFPVVCCARELAKIFTESVSKQNYPELINGNERKADKIRATESASVTSQCYDIVVNT